MGSCCPGFCPSYGESRQSVDSAWEDVGNCKGLRRADEVEKELLESDLEAYPCSHLIHLLVRQLDRRGLGRHPLGLGLALGRNAGVRSGPSQA